MFGKGDFSFPFDFSENEGSSSRGFVDNRYSAMEKRLTAEKEDFPVPCRRELCAWMVMVH